MTTNMRRVLAMGVILLAAVACASAQTTYNLPDASCAIQGGSYLFCSDMAQLTINGVLYEVDSVTGITNLYQYPATAPVVSGDVELQNTVTGIYTTGFDNTNTSTYENYVLTQNFSGDLNGTMTFTLLRKHPQPPCGRYCYLWHYYAHNVTLTIQ